MELTLSCLARMLSTLSAILDIKEIKGVLALSSDENSILTQSMSFSWILDIHMMTSRFLMEMVS